MADDSSEHPISLSEMRAQRANDPSLLTPRDVLRRVLRDIEAGFFDPNRIVIAMSATCECGSIQTGFHFGGTDLPGAIGVMEMVKDSMLRGEE